MLSYLVLKFYVLYLQTVAVNEQLQREKASLEKCVSELKEDFIKVSTELQNVLQNFSKMETEKEVLLYGVTLDVLRF